MKIINEKTCSNYAEVITALKDEINALKPMEIKSLNPENTSLIIVDVINGFIREGAMASQRIETIIPPVADLMSKCNKLFIPVIMFADSHKENCAEFESFPAHCVENTRESEPVDELKNAGGYFLIKKNSTNGFHENDFQKSLMRNPNINTVIVTGDCTDICVLQFCLTLRTWYTKQNKNIKIIIPINCVETYDSPNHNGDFMNLAAYKIMSDSGITFVKEIV